MPDEPDDRSETSRIYAVFILRTIPDLHYLFTFYNLDDISFFYRSKYIWTYFSVRELLRVFASTIVGRTTRGIRHTVPHERNTKI
jgi:hypothetical protein